jgi:flagellar motor switch protein FliN/FliY
MADQTTPSPTSHDTAAHAPSAPSSERSLSTLADLPLPVSVELGRTKMTIQEVLRLGRGSIVQLERLIGEPVDLYVGDRRFAECEVVTHGEHFGIRITRVLESARPEQG